MSDSKHILLMPDLGDSETEGVVAGLLVVPGEAVVAGQTLIEVETEKVVVEIPAEIDATIESFIVAVGDTVRAGDAFANVIKAKSSATAKSSTQECVTVAAPLGNWNSLSPDRASDSDFRVAATSVPAGPAARRLARELGFSVANVVGSGPRGRISVSDVKAHAYQLLNNTKHYRPIDNEVQRSVVDLAHLGPVTRKSMSSVQLKTMRNMTRAAERIPHAWIEERIDITGLEAGRRQQKEAVAEEGGALTLTVLLCKILALTLRDFPIFNAVVDDEKHQILYREQINIGIAVDTPQGLLVPVIRNVNEKSIVNISQELADLSRKASKRRLALTDMQGASMTISNLGSIGTTSIFPIVNWPEAAIIGVSASQWVPTYVAGDTRRAPEPRLMLPIVLSFDHRLINGADAARFMCRIKSLCEAPFLLSFRDEGLWLETAS